MNNIPVEVWKIEVTYQYDGTRFSAKFSEIIDKRVVVSLTRVWRYVSDTDDEWVGLWKQVVITSMSEGEDIRLVVNFLLTAKSTPPPRESLSLQ